MTLQISTKTSGAACTGHFGKATARAPPVLTSSVFGDHTAVRATVMHSQRHRDTTEGRPLQAELCLRSLSGKNIHVQTNHIATLTQSAILCLAHTVLGYLNGLFSENGNVVWISRPSYSQLCFFWEITNTTNKYND